MNQKLSKLRHLVHTHSSVLYAIEGFLTKSLTISQICPQLWMQLDKDYTNEFPKFSSPQTV